MSIRAISALLILILSYVAVFKLAAHVESDYRKRDIIQPASLMFHEHFNTDDINSAFDTPYHLKMALLDERDLTGQCRPCEDGSIFTYVSNVYTIINNNRNVRYLEVIPQCPPTLECAKVGDSLSVVDVPEERVASHLYSARYRPFCSDAKIGIYRVQLCRSDDGLSGDVHYKKLYILLETAFLDTVTRALGRGEFQLLYSITIDYVRQEIKVADYRDGMW